MQEDLNTYGTPARVIDAAQSNIAPRRSPTGVPTNKAYFYNTGEQISKGDVVLYSYRSVRKTEVVQSGAGGDTENPTVKFASGKTARASLLTLQHRTKDAAVAMVALPPKEKEEARAPAAAAAIDEEKLVQLVRTIVIALQKQ